MVRGSCVAIGRFFDGGRDLARLMFERDAEDREGQ